MTDRAPDRSRRFFDPFTRTTIKTDPGGQGDLYHRAVRMAWAPFLALLGGGFVLINVLFAALYMLGEDRVNGARANSFLDHFFFGVQTIATIGYGVMSPRSTYGNILVTAEAMIGMLRVASVLRTDFSSG
ncbi:MAG: ion channel [Steroidobacteraceae bacterium]